jgi:hypothetical protein
VIAWYMALHLSVMIRASVPRKEPAPCGLYNNKFSKLDGAFGHWVPRMACWIRIETFLDPWNPGI